MSKLELTVTGVEEERKDRWAVRSQEFGFTVYGKTLGEAQESFHKAVITLIDSFAGDDALLRDCLDKKGVQHRFIKESPTSEERYFERRLEVGLGSDRFSINGPELIRILEMMGLTLHHKSGPFCVFLDQMPAERVLFITDGWDSPLDDIKRTLRQNRIDVDRFWECREKLYQN